MTPYLPLRIRVSHPYLPPSLYLQIPPPAALLSRLFMLWNVGNKNFQTPAELYSSSKVFVFISSTVSEILEHVSMQPPGPVVSGQSCLATTSNSCPPPLFALYKTALAVRNLVEYLIRCRMSYLRVHENLCLWLYNVQPFPSLPRIP